MSTTRANTDAGKLKWALTHLLGVPTTQVDYDGDDIVKALHHAGVQGFNDDFTVLTEDDLSRLTIPPDDPSHPHQPLPISKIRKLIILSAFFQAACRNCEGIINVSSTTKIQFDDFRTGQYDPTKPIVPWNTPLRSHQAHCPLEHAIDGPY